MKVVGLNQYQQLTRRTENKELGLEMRLLNMAVGLCGEGAEVSELLTKLDPRLAQLASDLQASAGRFAEHVKKSVFHRHPDYEATKANLRKEIGDLLWYVAASAGVLDASLEDIATENIEKLAKRYPNGFSAEASANRKV